MTRDLAPHETCRDPVLWGTSEHPIRKRCILHFYHSHHPHLRGLRDNIGCFGMMFFTVLGGSWVSERWRDCDISEQFGSEPTKQIPSSACISYSLSDTPPWTVFMPGNLAVLAASIPCPSIWLSIFRSCPWSVEMVWVTLANRFKVLSVALASFLSCISSFCVTVTVLSD